MINLNLVIGVSLCVLCYGQDVTTGAPSSNSVINHGVTQRIGNFSLELLHFTTEQQERKMNLIMSPVTAWTLLAVIAEGARGKTLTQICLAIRIRPKERVRLRTEIHNILQYLQIKTNAVTLEKINAIFVDRNKLPLSDFIDIANEYGTKMIQLDFGNIDITANAINRAVTTLTRGRINSVISSDDILNSHMIMTSTLYFKGLWTAPFNASMTRKEPFYSSTGERLGEVNMMHNRFNYPFAYIESLKGKVLEIPYGNDNRLSMLIFLPNMGVSLKEMFLNFQNTSLSSIFNELKVFGEENEGVEIDCYLPRFKIESKLDLTAMLKDLGVYNLFDETAAELVLARLPLHVSKVIHKAEIEVTEEGTTAVAVTSVAFADRIAVMSFEANRPFFYLIVEKTTNVIIFGGFYYIPTLY